MRTWRKLGTSSELRHCKDSTLDGRSSVLMVKLEEAALGFAAAGEPQAGGASVAKRPVCQRQLASV